VAVDETGGVVHLVELVDDYAVTRAIADAHARFEMHVGTRFSFADMWPWRLNSLSAMTTSHAVSITEAILPEPNDSTSAVSAADPHGGQQCLDCGALSTGAFCGSCGQRREAPLLPLRQIVAEAVGDLTNIDGKSIRTLATLFRHPGRVTRDYIAGRRTRYVAPFRLFLVASAVYFSVILLTGSTSFLIFGANLTVNGEPAGPGPFADFIRLAPRLMFLLLPVFAIFLKVMYAGSGRLYAEHVVLSLHYYSIVFLVFAVTTITESIALAASAAFPQAAVSLLQIGTLECVMMYLAITLRRVFGGSRLAAAARSLALWVLSLATILGTIEIIYRRAGMG
jgi:hypothetical protein